MGADLKVGTIALGVAGALRIVLLLRRVIGRAGQFRDGVNQPVHLLSDGRSERGQGGFIFPQIGARSVGIAEGEEGFSADQEPPGERLAIDQQLAHERIERTFESPAKELAGLRGRYPGARGIAWNRLKAVDDVANVFEILDGR